jgi:hypothetical protein
MIAELSEKNGQLNLESPEKKDGWRGDQYEH